MLDMSFPTVATCPMSENNKRRLADLKKKLSVNIKKILDEAKKETEELEKDTITKCKVYRNLSEVQCMKDVKSQNGFYHEYELGAKVGEGCHSSVYKCILRN